MRKIVFIYLLILFSVANARAYTTGTYLIPRKIQPVAATKKKIISPEEAKKIAEGRFGGTALSVKFEDGGGAGSVYRVKLIKSGRVRTVTVSATP